MWPCFGSQISATSSPSGRGRSVKNGRGQWDRQVVATKVEVKRVMPGVGEMMYRWHRLSPRTIFGNIVVEIGNRAGEGGGFPCDKEFQ